MMSVLQGDYWLTSFFLNILGYGAVIIPAALAIHYLKNSESIKNGRIIIFMSRVHNIKQTFVILQLDFCVWPLFYFKGHMFWLYIATFIEYLVMKIFTYYCLGSGPFYSFLRCCIIGGNVTDTLQNAEEGGTPAKDKSISSDETSANNITYYVKLVLCVIGLQISYLFWGVLQVSIPI